MRTTQFISNGYYHIFNRGVDKRKVFLRYGHYSRFLHTIRSLLDTGSATERSIKNQSLALKYKINIICYCLMPNHYHFLIQQIEDGGISEFMHNLNTSYTLYFDKNNNRTGRLFEYTFKAKEIDSDETLLHISRYIHLNPRIGKIVQDLSFYPWSSYLEYIGEKDEPFCQKEIILAHFGNDPKKYEAFVNDQVSYAQLLHQIEHEEKEESLYL
jgi:putative transposase